MTNKIDHIGIAVHSIQRALKFYEDILGLKQREILEVPERGVRAAMIDGGYSTIELIEPMGPDSPLTKFLEKRGEGIHHIAFEVTDIERTMENLKAKDIEFINPKPYLGTHNRKVVFLSPKSCHGVLIELCQRTI